MLQVPLPLKINTGMSTLGSPASLQDEDELRQFIEVMRAADVRSYLEIGVRYGGTFETVCNALPLEKAVALDFPGGKFGDPKSVKYLIAALDRISQRVRDVHLVLGPSEAGAVVERIRDLAPFDAILIDGNHSYDGVRRDYTFYDRFATKLIAFHDIAAPKGTTDKRGSRIEVGEYWQAVKQQNPRTSEIVADGSIMGFGLVHKTIP